MGGSVVVRACPKLQDLGYIVSGVAVLDVVEGMLFMLASALFVNPFERYRDRCIAAHACAFGFPSRGLSQRRGCYRMAVSVLQIYFLVRECIPRQSDHKCNQQSCLGADIRAFNPHHSGVHYYAPHTSQ